MNNITYIRESKKQINIIYFDLSKAFDTVPHKALIHKMKWMEDYLSNRVQRVVIYGGNSTWLEVTSGVPQGSILGPLLFLISIYDLPDVISSETKCENFADN